MKNLQNFKGAKMISKNEQKLIIGGHPPVNPCGEAGGVISTNPWAWCDIKVDGVCWVCR